MWLPFPFLCACSCPQVGVNTGMVKRVIFPTFSSLGNHMWDGHWSHLRTAYQTSNMITFCKQQLYIFEFVSPTEPSSPTTSLRAESESETMNLTGLRILTKS